MMTSNAPTEKPNNVSYDDDDKVINFKKLEKELSSAVEQEERYWRENDAKFRAVKQKVASYDEFRDIVMASHLKPLEKDDRLTEIKFIQPWNTQASKKQESANKSDAAEIPKSTTYPTSGQGFIREWRRFNKDTSIQYSYLLELGGERLAAIFKPEIGFGLLGEFGQCLNCGFQESDLSSVLNILSELSRTNRFTLTVQFLSSKEKECFVQLFGKLRQCVGEENDIDMTSMLASLHKSYGIKVAS